jgi:predicted small lipoprotein YifL
MKGCDPFSSYTLPMRVLLLACCAALGACGQTGALYLPDEGVETPVEIRGPAAPAPAPVSAPESDDEEKKDDPAQGR